jgi:hypothetical protein
MRSRILAALMVLMLVAPAGAAITDVEPDNDTIPAPMMISKTGDLTIAAGELVLDAGDIDFLGIADLSAGDVVTVTTTPLDDADFEIPNTMVGVFDSSTTDPTNMILCRGNNSANNNQDNCPQGQCPGYGSLCRFLITAPGDYYVGVTGFRPKVPSTCTPGVNCTSHPFDGGIGVAPCQESGPTTTCGNYQVTIAVNALPEPSVILQLLSGSVGLAWLDRWRKRRSVPSRN